MNKTGQRIQTAARVVLVVKDKVEVMNLTGETSLRIKTEEGARMIKELGDGFVACAMLLQAIQHDLRQGAITCTTCQKILRGLGELPYDDIEHLGQNLG